MPKGTQFYNVKDISDITGMCYAKALAFIKYSGINYLRINRVYLIKKDVFDEFVKSTHLIQIKE